MEYDNTCIKMVIGRQLRDKMPFMQTAVVPTAKCFTCSYFKMVNWNRLLMIPMPGSLSAYASGDIADIDNDGIIEFSIYTEDPIVKELPGRFG